MKSKFLLFFTITAILIQACDDAGFQPKGDYISGWVTFADTNITQNGYYSIALYKNVNQPFACIPTKMQTIDIKPRASCYYRIQMEGEGNYYVAVTWTGNENWLGYPVLMGTFGCDTSHYCTKHTVVQFPNFSGLNHSFLCWADTTKRLN